MSVLDADVDYQEIGSRPDSLRMDGVFYETESRICAALSTWTPGGRPDVRRLLGTVVVGLALVLAVPVALLVLAGAWLAGPDHPRRRPCR